MSLSISIITGLVPMLCWGIADFLQSIVVRKINTYKAMFINNVLGIIVTLPFWFFINKSIHMNNLILLSIGGLIQVVAMYNFFQSMKIGEVSIVAPISATYPLVTLALLVFLLGQQISLFKILAILILIMGIILTSTDLRKIKHMHTVSGIKESIITLFCWGTYFFIMELIAKNTLLFGINFPATDAMTTFFYSNITMAVPMLFFSMYKKGILQKKDYKLKKIMLIVIVNAIIYTTAWIVINYGFVNGITAIIAPISSLYPAITVLLAEYFYKEKLVINQKIGLVIIFIGLILISV